MRRTGARQFVALAGTDKAVNTRKGLQLHWQRERQQDHAAWDVESPALKDFDGFKYWPINPDLCLEATFISNDPPRTFTVTDVIGSLHESSLLGEVHFKING
ncbi:MAG: hypothetical protein FP831_11690 [Anaerolineae bacterium]|nr:hypothetical protein [Anaerolineae bacterium]